MDKHIDKQPHFLIWWGDGRWLCRRPGCHFEIQEEDLENFGYALNRDVVLYFSEQDVMEEEDDDRETLA